MFSSKNNSYKKNSQKKVSYKKNSGVVTSNPIGLKKICISIQTLKNISNLSYDVTQKIFLLWVRMTSPEI